MRYISPIANLALIDEAGGFPYKFNQGELVVGSYTDDSGPGDRINDSVTPHPLYLYADDCDGGSDNTIEWIGQGSLDGLCDDGDVIAGGPVYRLFYKSPLMAGGDSLSGCEDICYEVLAGTVTYNSEDFTKGDIIRTDGSETTTSGSGMFALTWCSENVCECFRDELFKVKNMMKGDEAYDYFLWTNGGFAPMNDTCLDNADSYGWIRK